VQFAVTPEEYAQLVELIARAVSGEVWPTELAAVADQLLGGRLDVPHEVLDVALLDVDDSQHEALGRFWLMIDALGIPRRPVHRSVVQAVFDEEGLDAVLAIMTIGALATWQLEDWTTDSDRPPTSEPLGDGLLIFMIGWTSEQKRSWLDALVANATSELHLAVIGAGPLEDFISNDPHDLAWLEQRLSTSDGYRRALAGAWIWNQVSAETLDRLERLCGSPLRRA